MAGSLPTSSISLSGDGAPAASFQASLPDFSPVPSTGYPSGVRPELIARYVVLSPLFFSVLSLFLDS